jgi:hypothetical protein
MANESSPSASATCSTSRGQSSTRRFGCKSLTPNPGRSSDGHVATTASFARQKKLPSIDVIGSSDAKVGVIEAGADCEVVAFGVEDPLALLRRTEMALLLPDMRDARLCRIAYRSRVPASSRLRLRWTVIASATTAAAAFFVACIGRAGEPSGLELGVRTGYALPLGRTTGNANDEFSDTTSGVVPIWFDVGCRFNEHMLLGAYLQYGSAHSDTTQDCQTGTCPATDILFGGQFHYHLFPDRLVDPWFGIGAGYEILNFTKEGGGTVDYTLEGFDFFNIQAGADIKIMRNVGIGPFGGLTLGQFSNCSDSCSMPNIAPQALHEWLTFGIRFVYDIAIPSLVLPPPAPHAHSPSDDWTAPGDRPPPFP